MDEEETQPKIQEDIIHCLDEEETQPKIQEEIIHCLDEDEASMFLKKEEHDESSHDIGNHEIEKPSDYLKGYQHDIFEMQKKYNLRSRNVPTVANKNQPKKDGPKVPE